MKRPHVQRYPTNSWAGAEYDNVPEIDYRDAKRRERPRAQRMALAIEAEWGERPAHNTKKNAARHSADAYAS